MAKNDNKTEKPTKDAYIIFEGNFITPEVKQKLTYKK